MPEMLHNLQQLRNNIEITFKRREKDKSFKKIVC